MGDSRLHGKSVLVTGGAGFIGGYVAETLTDRADVIVLDDFSTGDETTVLPSCDVVEADVRDADAVAAAVDGTLNVFEASHTHGARAELGYEPTVSLSEGLSTPDEGR